MSSYIKRAVFATVVLIALGGGAPLIWYSMSADELQIEGPPEDTRAELARISDEERLRELALLLLESTKQTSELQRATLETGRAMMYGVIFVAVVGVLFVWGCVIGCIKEDRRSHGRPLGTLKWL